ncbi:chaperone required for assembly of F1-ATPase [Roseovarius halotolerans]|uniref:ATP12 chaperone protein n=1 Tax=Roseovarius halotolerans TaxID=505353 RepID=A0A1X6ZWK3_9RHOB|nr:ATP12 family protein [Roseovarius halotolerans]RKT32121.1 chaperone required for assembly of F1-ATPase [Roseovarius halotolerans]SLN63920.1 ATP12 chaperone protein [Roseovarius halotolerans]
MSEWKARRFWKAAEPVAEAGGFTVRLDGRPVKTPAKAPLIVPAFAMAEAIAAEWDAQGEQIDPNAMSVTRAANAAIDKVAHQHAEVAQMLADYGDSDLLCYRAESPVELVERQQATWDPLLDWAADTLGARLRPVTGVMHAPQDGQALATLARQVQAMDAFTLTAFHDLVSLSGSLVIGFAALHSAHDTAALWQASRVDETWQEELWGPDEEARDHAARKESAFYAAKRFHDLLGERQSGRKQ